MNSKQRVIAVLEGKTPDCTPAGFSLHFPVEESAGQAGVESHGRFLRETHVDILKVMNENLVPDVGEVKTPADWQKVCDICRDDTFIRRQLDFAKRVLDSCADAQAFALGTLHGIVASGIHPYEASYGYDGARTLQVMHLRENPALVLEAFKRITERMCQLARGYAEIGMDGVYYAALGGETCWFTDEEFDRWVRPFDQEILSEIRSSGRYAFLHICKHGLNMQRYACYAPCCDAVNWGVYEAPLSMDEGCKLFAGKTIMGGLANRSGCMVEASQEELNAEGVRLAKKYGPEKYILGADCTLPTEIPYERIRALTDAVHEATRQ